MLIKNVTERPVQLRLKARTLDLGPGDERLITADEVRDAVLRDSLQVRTVAVVRPATEEEGAALVRELRNG